ncbi:MAG: hypothetical protein DME18_02965, partial [Verrucomicrobia bacterium]
MKYTNIPKLLVAVLILSFGVVGCQPKKGNVTPIPGQVRKIDGGEKPFGAEGPGTQLASEPNPNVRPGDVVPPVRFSPGEMNEDHNRFAANTVYFDFDRATVKPGETGKIDEVVRYLQANPNHAVQIEGHCDERGTEQYNLSLGDRRALAVREYMVTAGIQAERVFNISYGE